MDDFSTPAYTGWLPRPRHVVIKEQIGYDKVGVPMVRIERFPEIQTHQPHDWVYNKRTIEAKGKRDPRLLHLCLLVPRKYIARRLKCTRV